MRGAGGREERRSGQDCEAGTWRFGQPAEGGEVSGRD